MRDTACVDKGVFDSFDTGYFLPSRGSPDKLCSPFNF